MNTPPPDFDTLSRLLIFDGLAPEELSTLAALLHRRIVPAGTRIVSIAQQGEAVYIILDGTAKVHVEQADGTDVILAVLGPGETVGEMDMVDSMGRSANVITIEQTDLMWMDRGAFQERLKTIPTLVYNLARILSRRLRLSNAQVQSLAALDVYGRVARQLLAFAHEYGQPQQDGSVIIPFRLTQSDVSDLVGASRVRVNQVLVFYKAQGYISVDPNYRITLHNRDLLAERCR